MSLAENHEKITWLEINVIGGRPTKSNMTGDKCHGWKIYERTLRDKGSLNLNLLMGDND